MARLAGIDLDLFPLNLGGNPFGWTCDKDASFAVLDAFVEAGGNFVDTADLYSAWVPGNSGGESEAIIGEWLAARGCRDRVAIATKTGAPELGTGLSKRAVESALERSLHRLGTEYVDLYYAHFDDADTPLEETVAAFGALVADGLVRYTAVSNYSAARVREWVRIADELGVARPVALQPHYNLVHRETEDELIPAADELGLGVVPYFALAKGFLTGKYRTPDAEGHSSPRATQATSYATPQGLQILDVLDRIGAERGIAPASVALAWLRAKPAVVAPIASASRLDQLPALLAGATTDLTADEVAALDAVSEWTPADM